LQIETKTPNVVLPSLRKKERDGREDDGREWRFKDRNLKIEGEIF
jgi:hypothetical protein